MASKTKCVSKSELKEMKDKVKDVGMLMIFVPVNNIEMESLIIEAID